MFSMLLHHNKIYVAVYVITLSIVISLVFHVNIILITIYIIKYQNRVFEIKMRNMNQIYFEIQKEGISNQSNSLQSK